MHPRAAQLLDELGLSPHPEGGYYREIHRSGLAVKPDDGRGRRSAVTTIYFLLLGGQPSRWHRVRSDEVWHHLEGAVLEMLEADPALERVGVRILGPHASGVAPVHVIQRDWWQAARTTGDYTLVSCSVGPGFDFADFMLLRDMPDEANALRETHPEVVDLL